MNIYPGISSPTSDPTKSTRSGQVEIQHVSLVPGTPPAKNQQFQKRVICIRKYMLSQCPKWSTVHAATNTTQHMFCLCGKLTKKKHTHKNPICTKEEGKEQESIGTDPG